MNKTCMSDYHYYPLKMDFLGNNDPHNRYMCFLNNLVQHIKSIYYHISHKYYLLKVLPEDISVLNKKELFFHITDNDIYLIYISF